MKLLFIDGLLFSPFLPEAESIFEEIRDPESILNDPLAFSKLVETFINGDGLQKKVEFEQTLDDWTDSVFKNLGGGFVADLKDKLNELYRPGGIPKKLTTQDIITQVEQEGTRNRKIILDLQNTINMQRFEDIVRDIHLFESNVARVFNSSFNNETMAKQLFASTDGKLIPMADSLKLMVTGDTNNIMQLSMDKDDLCTNKTLLDTKSSVLNLLSRLNFVAFIVASLKEGRIPVAEHGIDPIALVLKETRIASDKYIKEFKSKNRCWSQSRVFALIGKAIESDLRGNLTKKADEMVKMLSKESGIDISLSFTPFKDATSWESLRPHLGDRSTHPSTGIKQRDNFTVIVKGQGCDTGCTFQESFKPADFCHWLRTITSLPLKDLVVKHLNFTVIRSQTPIPYHEHARVMQLMEKKMEGKADLKCEFDALHFLETWERLAYVALNNGGCDTVIRNTHSSASFRMDLQYKSISGKAFSYWEFGRKLHPSGVTMDVLMVLKCVQILKDGQLNQYCGF